MKNKTERKAHGSKDTPPLHRVRLPGFITGDEIGLGDAIKRATSYIGIPSCGGCERRADTLNRWMIFTNRQTNH